MKKKQETTLTIIELAIRKIQFHIRDAQAYAEEAQAYAEEAQSAASCSPIPAHIIVNSIGDIITQLRLIDQQADGILLNILNPSIK